MHEQALSHSAMNQYESILGKDKEFWVKVIFIFSIESFQLPKICFRV